jgi:transcriptional regulator with XRE-family HTH domain
MKLREWREKMGWSQQDLAKALKKISQESVSQWESGEIMPRKSVLQSIHKLTNGKVTANDFM